MATVTSTGSRLVLPDAGVTLMIPDGALKSGQVQEHYLAILREDRYRPKISGQSPIEFGCFYFKEHCNNLVIFIIFFFLHCDRSMCRDANTA